MTQLIKSKSLTTRRTRPRGSRFGLCTGKLQYVGVAHTYFLKYLANRIPSVSSPFSYDLFFRLLKPLRPFIIRIPHLPPSLFVPSIVTDICANTGADPEIQEFVFHSTFCVATPLLNGSVHVAGFVETGKRTTLTLFNCQLFVILRN